MGVTWAAAQVADGSILMDSVALRIRESKNAFAQLPEHFIFQGKDPLNCRQHWGDESEDPFQFDRSLMLAHLRSSSTAVVLMPSFERESDPAFQGCSGSYVVGSRGSNSRVSSVYRLLTASDAEEEKIQDSWKAAKHIPFVALLTYAVHDGAIVGRQMMVDEAEIATRTACVVVGACGDELSIFCVLDMGWWSAMNRSVNR